MQTTDQATTTVRFLLGNEIGIPDVFREELGIDDSTLLVLTTVDGELRIRPFHFDFDKNPPEKGSPWLHDLYAYFAPVREEILASGITQAFTRILDRSDG